MIKLFTEKEFEEAKSMDKLPLQCEQCGKTFFVEKKMIKYIDNHQDGKRKNSCKFCSHKCFSESQKMREEQICANCGKTISVKPSCLSKSKSGNHFCCKSCSVTYNNKHKKYGTRRSKLEEYLEKKLTELYPELEIKYNSKEEICSELDIYIPKYKLAFELNGIFHYEPIFGLDRLQKTQKNDINKFQLCQENNISLCVIDTSSLKYFKEQNAEKYLNIVTNIINESINSITN